MKEKCKVDGMMCAGCSQRVEKVLKEMEGVNSVDVNLLSAMVNIDYDENVVTLKDMAKVIADSGYEMILENSDDSNEEQSHNEEQAFVEKAKAKAKRAKTSLFVSIGLTLVIMYIAMGHMMGLPSIPFIMTNPLAFVVSQFVVALAVMIINIRFFKRGIVAVIKNRGGANMDTLVSLGSLSSMISGIIAFVNMVAAMNANDTHLVHEIMHNLYFETAAMILTLVSVGKYFEAKAKGSATSEIDKLLSLAPEKATLKIGEMTKEVASASLRVGDIVVLKAGGKVPADLEIISGKLEMDESMLTGESESVTKEAPSKLAAGTIVLSGDAEARVTVVGKDTTLSRLIALVEEAASSKAPSQRFADKVSRIFVPVVLGIALLTLIIWVLVTGDFERALNFAISVLVVSCPCALGLATPVSIMVSTTMAAKIGILIKNSEILERCGHTTDIFFDKTGTITEGTIGEKNSDKPREGAKEAMSLLAKMGINTTMLSGDKKDIALRIAGEVGIQNVKYELLPEDKLNNIKECKGEGKTVMMVGDGINDSPALKLADVGVGLSKGTDISIESADVILVGSRLEDIPKLIKLSKRTLTNIKQNLFWALIYNSLCIPLAAGAFVPLIGISMNPMVGSVCMGLSSLFVVANALRLKRFKG